VIHRDLKPSNLVVGLMFGTGADSIEVAIGEKCRIGPDCG